MYRLISTLPIGQALSYIDDVLLHSQDPTGLEMVGIIDKFLTRVTESGGRINVAKTELVRTQVQYLGFIVSNQGVCMDTKYRQALLDFPPPKSPQALARFLGMVTFYKHFLWNLAEDSAHLHTLKTQKWTEMPDWAVEDFHKIKNSLLNSEALASPNFKDLSKHPFILGLDFSNLAIGITLSQIQQCRDGDTRRRLI